MEEIQISPPPEPKHSLGEKAWLTRYLVSSLCPAMGVQASFDEIALPTYGLKSTLLLVRPHDSTPFVLRIFERASVGEKLLGHVDLARSAGLGVPKILYSDLSKGHFREHGFGIVVEELIEGTHLRSGEVGSEKLAKLGEGLARIHSVQSPRWGTPGRTRRGAFFGPMIQAKIENRLASIARFDEEFQKSWRERIMKWVKAQARDWEGGPPYALTHDKINTGNVLFSEGPRVHFLDLVTLRFGAPGKDLAAALYYFAAGDSEEATLKESYFGRLPAERREHFERFEGLYRAWHHLGRWAGKARANHKRKKKAADALDNRRGRALEREAVWRWIEGG